MDHVPFKLQHDVAVRVRLYLLLMKPGIIFGNVITALGGIALASGGHLSILSLFGIIFGLSLVMGSACIFNNYIDRQMDEKMARTKNRPFVTQEVGVVPALFFASCVGILGTLCLMFCGNSLAAMIAFFGFCVYVLLYSPMKSRSVHATLVGSIAGAVPPVVGYVAVSQVLDLGAFILFAIIVLWQMPHFFAIASYRLADYAAAGVPVLPIKRGMQMTKIQMLLYVIAFIPVSQMLFFYGYAGKLYLTIATLLGGAWLVVALEGFKCQNDQKWARKMFIFSLVVVMGICGAISL